ncbi:MAG TPA: sugar phosphate isomerase/epimerase family protein [Chthonomonadales bacterium]|nr:sugar phosphate isomerase/epimerase family protein [Chthonomonadales bacterium]
MPQPVRRVGPPRLAVGCCAYSYREHLTGAASPALSVEGFLDECARAGCDGVELTSYYLPNPLPYHAARLLATRACRLGLHIAGTAVGGSLALPAGPERDAQIGVVRRWIDACIDLGGASVRVFAGAAPEGVPEVTARKWAVESLLECLAHASDRGVLLALENHGGLTATAEGLLGLVDTVSSEWLAVELDTGNFLTEDPYADLARCSPYAVAVHVKTDIFPAGHREATDYARIAQLLRESGYRGYLHLEYEGREPAWTAVPEALRAIRAATAASQGSP